MPEICTDKRMASLFGNRRCQTSLLLNLVQHQNTTQEPCRLVAKTGLKTVYNHSDGWSSLVLLQFSMFLFGHNCVLVHNLEIYAIRNKARVLTLYTLTQSGNNKYCQTRRRKLDLFWWHQSKPIYPGSGWKFTTQDWTLSLLYIFRPCFVLF